MQVVVRTASAPALSAGELDALARIEAAARAAPTAAGDLAAALPLSAPLVRRFTAGELEARGGELLRALATWIAWGLPPRARGQGEAPRDYARALEDTLYQFAAWPLEQRELARRVGRELRRFARDPIVAELLVRATNDRAPVMNQPEWRELAARCLELARAEPRPVDVGGGVNAGALDFSKVIGAIEKSTPAERFIWQRPAPAGLELAPSGDPFVVLHKVTSGDVLLGGFGVDSTAQRWAIGGFFSTWTQVDKGNPDALVNVIDRVVKTVVVPAVGAVLTAVGGPAGFAAALALSTWARLAAGASITSALVQSAYEQLGSQIEKTSYFATYQTLASNAYTGPQIAKLREGVAEKFAVSPTLQARALQAFDLGTVMAEATRTQRRALELVNALVPTDEQRRYITETMAEGATLADVIYANYGASGLGLLEKLTAQAAREVGDPIVLPFVATSSSPSSSTPSSTPWGGGSFDSPFGGTVSGAAPSSSSSSSSGGAVVALAAVALLAFGGFKL